jgi:universal stress protein E
MQTIRKILVNIDPDKPQQPALKKALKFVNKQSISIKLYSCLYYPSIIANNFLSPTQLEKTKEAILKEHQSKLNKLVKQNQHNNVSFETEVAWHSPIYQAVLKVVDTYKPDLLIKATHQHKTLARRLFTPTDWYLLKACPVPVMLVKNIEWTKNKTKIVAAINPEHNLSKESGVNKQILKTAFDVSQQLDSPLHAIHCFDPSYWEILFEAVAKTEIWGDVFPIEKDQPHNESMILEKLRLQHNLKFAEQCTEYVPNSEYQHIVSGEIDDVLPDTLNRLHAGILVLGTTYRTGLLGSTAQRLIETVDCDLLAVKPKGFEAPFH